MKRRQMIPLTVGNAEAAKQRSRARQLAGTQAATMSANGVDLGAGGALDIFGDTAAMGNSMRSP